MSPPVVSVIMAAYNVAPFLPACLRSLVDQTLGFGHIEIIVVDDGSTDGTAELLDEFAAGRPNVAVVHQENSGGPGGPRNRGIELSAGEFLFFVDPDDYLGVEALERMVAVARRNQSDIVLGKIVGVGRNAPSVPFRRNVERGDVYSTGAIYSMGAQKLFRRSLIVEHGLRFIEHARLGEDQEFVVGAYLLARVISVVADYPCYFLALRNDGANATRSLPRPAELYELVERVLELVTSHTDPGQRRNALLRRFYTIEILSRVRGAFHELPAPVQADLVRYARPLLRYFPDEVVEAVPAHDRLRGHLLRSGMVDELAELTRFEAHESRRPPVVEDGRVYARLPFFRDVRNIPDACFDITTELVLDHCVERASMTAGRLRVSWEPFAPALLVEDVEWSLVLRGRQRDVEVVVPSTRAAGHRWQVDIDLKAVSGGAPLPDGAWDLMVLVSRGREMSRKFVGAAGTLAGFYGPAAVLLDDRVAVLRANMNRRLVLEVGPHTTRLRADVDAIEGDDAAQALRVTGRFFLGGMADAVVPTVNLVLRERTSGASATFPAVAALSAGGPLEGTSPELWNFRASVGLEDAARLVPGVRDAYVIVQSESARVEGRLHADAMDELSLAAAVAGGHVLVPYLTAARNLSIDVGPTSRRVYAQATATRWDMSPGGRRLDIGGTVEVVPHVVGAMPSAALVVRQRSTGRELTAPGHRDLGAALSAPPRSDVWPFAVSIDLRRPGTSGDLAPGRWDVVLRVRVNSIVVDAPVRYEKGETPPRVPVVRWWDRRRGLASARTWVRHRHVVVEVRGAPDPWTMGRIVRRHLTRVRRATRSWSALSGATRRWASRATRRFRSPRSTGGRHLSDGVTRAEGGRRVS